MPGTNPSYKPWRNEVKEKKKEGTILGPCFSYAANRRRQGGRESKR